MEVEEQIEAYDWSMLDDLIERHHNEQFTALDKSLIKNSKDWETLLHSTAIHDNEMIARYLLEMGVDVDFLNDHSETPLFIAVEQSSSEVVKVLLEANANIDIANADGINALQEVFDVEHHYCTTILRLMLERLRNNSSTMEELLERLMGLGCSMYLACFLKDRRVMELLLKRGVSIDSRGYYDRTALYAAVELNDVNLAKWILDKGAEVNSFDEEAGSPLFHAASGGKVDLVHLLLEHGADPNRTDPGYDDAYCTPLFAVFSHSRGSKNQQAYDECAELLLQHGAIPRNSSLIYEKTIFDHFMLNTSDGDMMFYVIGQLAILDILGKTNVESVMCSRNNDENVRHLLNAQLKKVFCLCESYKVILVSKVYGKLSLLNFLTDGEDKMRVYARDRELVDLIHNAVIVELSDDCPYYCRLLKKRISKAIETVKLEDEGIHAVSQLLHMNYNLCYNFGRQLVRYLNDQDLKQLCLV